MKKQFIFIFIFAIFCWASMACIIFGQKDRPTNDWTFVYRDAKGQQQREVITSETGFDMAVKLWREKHITTDDYLVGVCQVSYLSCK